MQKTSGVSRLNAQLKTALHRPRADLARSPPRHREIACAILIDTSGWFLLQQRDDVAGIPHPGKVSLFGGHREGGETFLQCAVREIPEEISYFVPAERFEYLAGLSGGDIDAEAAPSTPSSLSFAIFRSKG